MAINFLNTVDLNFNQLNKAAIQNLGADPAAGVLGQVYYNTAVSALKICVTAQVIGGANAVWIEVGATSGVETITIGNANVNSGGVNTGLVRTPVAGTGDIILTPAIYGGAANVGMVPTGGTANKYLDGTGAWVDVTTGDIESVNAATAANLLGINITTPLGPNPTVGLDIVGRDVLGGAPAANDSLLIYDTDVAKNKKVTVANLKLATDTLYDLTTAPTGTAVRLTDAAGSDDVTISGTVGQTAMSRISASELRVALTDDVTIIDDLTVGGVITQAQANETNRFSSPIDMNDNKITEVKTGTLGTDAVNLAQVELLVAGIGVFKGSYNAATNTPALEGGSNIALDQGDYFVVSVAGTFLSQALEPGDFIFANNSITAGSSPNISNYTVVQADANIAGAGATDGATQKGVAGFDSENFAVSSNGWVQLKRQSNPYGISVPLTGGSNSGGETTFTVDITTAARFGAGALAANCKAEVVTTSGRQTVYPDITGNGTGSMVFKFIPTVSDSTYTALITIV
jgi:hypothetical protein